VLTVFITICDYISKHHSINFGSFEMQPSKQDLKTAFKRIEMALHGISFEQAMNMPGVVTGLKRMALNAQKPKVNQVTSQSPAKPRQEMWYDKY
jgi:hypothetical protein